MDSRAIAAKVLAKLFKQKQALDRTLPTLTAELDGPDRAFVQELCYGVSRWYYRLDFVLGKLLNKPIRVKDTDIKALLLCGLYQLDFLRTPVHAALSATVDAAVALKKPWAKQMINAVMRRYLREHEQFQTLVQNTARALYAHPDWLLSALQRDWPNDWPAIVQSNNEYPPMQLRVNLLLNERSAYLQKLNDAGLAARASQIVDCGVSLITATDVERLPGFQAGHVSVQDFGAQLAASLLDLKPKLRVLDACAAPGGKTAHIYEKQPRLANLIAVEHDDSRVKLLKETQTRLQIHAQIIHADARDTDSWWDGSRFDRILLDVPCSATGVIRRHPDIKLLRQADMIALFTVTQYELLQSMWPLLQHGGRLVYATCSLLTQENDCQIDKFTNNYTNARVVKIDGDWGIETVYGRQTVPGRDAADGFYYAILEKI